jgi:8-oxo-dGTP pyrophosphatase MutT (NUDIX family)
MPTVPWHGKEIPVYFSLGPDTANARIATESRIFREWLDGLDLKFEITEITITQVDFRGEDPKPENVLFVRLLAQTAKSPRKQIVELRGHTSAMLVHLICVDDNSHHTVLLKQSRVPTGCFDFVEIPAGMIDGGSFRGAAARELEEEIGLSFTEEELLDLTATLPKGGKGVYLSPGLLDERCTIYLAGRNVTLEELEKMHGRTTGVKGEGEFIKLTIIPMDELPLHVCDAKSLLAYALYLKHIEGR